jgi:hypothetical protein
MWACVVFSSREIINQKVLLNLVEKTKQTCMLLVLANYIISTISFDTWMSKRAHDAFALVVTF